MPDPLTVKADMLGIPNDVLIDLRDFTLHRLIPLAIGAMAIGLFVTWLRSRPR